MNPISFKRHRFPPDVIRYAVWLYHRFTLSLRDVEDLLAERGIDLCYKTVRCWANKFGPAIASNIRKTRRPSDCVWHLDEMIVKIGGKRMFMWRAVDKEGEGLDALVQKRHNKKAALKLLRKLLKNQGFVPEAIVTDGLASYKAALVQVAGSGPALRFHPLSDLQHLQYRASPRLTKDNAKIPRPCFRGVGNCVRFGQLNFHDRASVRAAKVTLTAPDEAER